jgi:hypothetical protein
VQENQSSRPSGPAAAGQGEPAGRGRRRGDNRLGPDARIPSPDELRRLYVDEQLSSHVIAQRCGVSSQWVRDRLRENDIPLRPRTYSRHGLDVATLRTLYQDQALSIDEIAVRYHRSSATIRRLLRGNGIPLRPRLPDLSEEVLRSMYVDQHLSVGEVARRLGVDPETVSARLDAHRIPGHSNSRTPWPGPALLRNLYTDQALEITQIAAQLHRSPQWIAALLDRYDIPRRPPSGPVAQRIPKQDLAELYVDQGLTAAGVAARLGYSERAVIAALRFHRLGPRRSGPAGRRGAVDPSTVVDLYVNHGLPPTPSRHGCTAQPSRSVPFLSTTTDRGAPARSESFSDDWTEMRSPTSTWGSV